MGSLDISRKYTQLILKLYIWIIGCSRLKNMSQSILLLNEVLVKKKALLERFYWIILYLSNINVSIRRVVDSYKNCEIKLVG